MTKAEQIEINETVEYLINRINENCDATGTHYVARLRSCNARVYKTHDYWLLQSYNTIVAAVDMRDGTKIDFLRYVYGYTATSAQHITKFFKDYGLWNVSNTRLTWREV